jgi:group I intron endonuclease
MTFSIYTIQNINNLKIYVGQSKQLYSRWRSHKTSVKNNKPILVVHRAMIKSGLNNFIFTEIETHDNQEDLDSAEEFWIAFFQSTKREFGYNIRPGGQHSKFSIKTRIKIKNKALNRIPWNKGTKGLISANSGSFQNGHKSWLSGTKGISINGYKSGHSPTIKGLKKIKTKENKILYVKKEEISNFEIIPLTSEGARGEKHGNSKLNAEKVLNIIKDCRESALLQKEICIKYGVSRTCISGIITGRIWGHLTGIIYSPKK